VLPNAWQKREIMKDSDFKQSERILRAINVLAEVGGCVTIHRDEKVLSNPNNCMVEVHEIDGDSTRFCGPTVMKCLQDAMIDYESVEEIPTEEEKPETRMYPAATAIVVMMRYLWGIRSNLLKVFESSAGPAIQNNEEQRRIMLAASSQRDNIRSAIGLAENALKPILEGLAGYCWVDLPEDVQNACRAAGVDNPDPWLHSSPVAKVNPPGSDIDLERAKIREDYEDFCAEIMERMRERLGLVDSVEEIRESIKRRNRTDGDVIYDAGGRVIDPARVGLPSANCWRTDGDPVADIKAARDRILADKSIGYVDMSVPKRLYVHQARFEWLVK
jgi:hypothetical protein